MNKLKRLTAALMSFVMCMTMGMGSSMVYAGTTGGTKSGNPAIADGGTYTEINIATLPEAGDKNGDRKNERECIIDKDGVYLLKGTNNDSGEYTPTHIEVATGVAATIYLQDFSIYNNDGLARGFYGPDDPMPDSRYATNPITVKAGSDVKLCLLDDAKFSINENGTVFCVEEGAKVTLEHSDYQLELSDTLAESKMSDPPTLLNLPGTFVMNGSRLTITGYSTKDDSSNGIDFYKSDDWFKKNPVGKLIINGGYADLACGGELYGGFQTNYEINGGQFPAAFYGAYYNVNDMDGESLHAIIPVTGLPANAELDLFRQYYKAGDEKRDYITTDVKTDENETVYVDIGKHNTVKDESGDLSGMIKCGGDWYELRFSSEDPWHCTATANKIASVYTVNYYDCDNTSTPLDTVYTPVDETGKAKYHFTEESGCKYKYYLNSDKTGGEFNFILENPVTDVYVEKAKKGYTITVSGMEQSSYELPYGESIPGADEYIFIDSDKNYWDGVATKDITVKAYPAVSIGGIKYVKLTSKADLDAFADEVNNNKMTDLNGYLATDIDAGNFTGIGTEDALYCGKFLGNHHKVKLAIDETDCTYRRSLFRCITGNCEIKGVETTGTITTNGRSAGGVVGRIYAAENSNCIIKECKSDVTITYTPGGEAECGGIIGYIYEYYTSGFKCNIENCLFNGTMKSGTAEKPLTKQGGIVGCVKTCWTNLFVNNCFVKAEFDAAAGANAGDSFMNVDSEDNYKYHIYLQNCYSTDNIPSSQSGTQKYDLTKGFGELAWRLNQTDSGNSGVWSYEDAGIIFADESHYPTYRVSFVDNGVFEGKDKRKTENKYTNAANKTVSAPTIPPGFLLEGQQAKWMNGDAEYNSAADITKDMEVTLAITDSNKYSVTITGDCEKSFDNVSYGTKLKDLINDENEYVFIGKNTDYSFTKVDGTCTEFVAYKISGTGDEACIEIASADDLKLFAAVVNGGILNINATLTKDIDISSISNFVIGKDADHRYNGHFDGNGHTIKVGIVETGAGGAAGLFRYAGDSAVIENLTLTGSIKSDAVYVGSLIGNVLDGGVGSYGNFKLIGCGSKVTIESTNTSGAYVGGLIGYAEGIKNPEYEIAITICEYSGTIKADSTASHCAGLIGQLYHSSSNILEGCFTHMAVTGCDAANCENIIGEFTDCPATNEFIYVYSDTNFGSKQAESVTDFTQEMIYWMNGGMSNPSQSKSCFSCYDKNAHYLIYADETYEEPHEIVFARVAVYADEGKYYPGSKVYSNELGKVTFPDMSTFLKEKHEAHWYMGDTEVTSNTKFTNDSDLYLKIKSNETYTIKVTGDLNKTITCKYEESLPEGYIYRTNDANNKFVSMADGTFDAVKAYALKTIEGKEYFLIDSAEKMAVFRDIINRGNETFNGYLTKDITLSDDFGNIGYTIGYGTYRSFKGTFEGNGHTITLNFTSDSGYEGFGRSLFTFVGNDAVIRNLLTTGTITSSTQYCGGIAGRVDGVCKLENCGSDVHFTYMPGGNCAFGGLIGQIIGGNTTVNNCYFAGSFAKGEDGAALIGQAGLVGRNDVVFNAANCWVDVAFDGTGENYVGGNKPTLTNCYYVTACGTSTQGTQISRATLASAEFAYNLNTTNGTKTSTGVWGYVKDAAAPCFALGDIKPLCRIKFENLIKDTNYESPCETSYAYTDSTGKVTFPDLSSYLHEGDKAAWRLEGNTVDEDTVFDNDSTLCLSIIHGDAYIKVERLQDVENPRYGTAETGRKMCNVTYKNLSALSTRIVEWKTTDKDGKTVWSTKAPVVGLGFDVEDGKVITTEKTPAGEYIFRITNATNEFIRGTTPNPDFVSSEEMTLTIDKLPVSVLTIPSASAISEGQRLSSSQLTGGAVSGDLLGKFVWTNPALAPALADSDTTEYDVTFIPEDAVNYMNATCKVTLTVNEAKHSGGNSSGTGGAPAGAIKTENVSDAAGNKAVITTDANGKQDTSVTVSEKAAKEAASNGTPIVLPIPEVKNAETKEMATAIKVTLPKGIEKAAVSIKVAEATNTTVLMQKNEDGTYSPVPTSVFSADATLTASITNGDYIIADNKVEFSDVNAESWYKDAADFAASRGLIVGIGADSFAGKNQLTAAQTVAILGRLQGESTAASWNKAIAENSNTEAISRQDTMKMLHDVYKTMNKAGTVNGDALTSFIDAGNVEAANLEAMQWAVSVGILNGVKENYLDPAGFLTRAQYATILQRFVELLSK